MEYLTIQKAFFLCRVEVQLKTQFYKTLIATTDGNLKIKVVWLLFFLISLSVCGLLVINKLIIIFG